MNNSATKSKQNLLSTPLGYFLIVGGTMILGFLSAFVSGLFACKVMIALVKKAKLRWFALYCLIAALSIFIFA